MTTGGCFRSFVKFCLQKEASGFFSEINPVPLYFILLKTLRMERSSDSQS